MENSGIISFSSRKAFVFFVRFLLFITISFEHLNFNDKTRIFLEFRFESKTYFFLSF